MSSKSKKKQKSNVLKNYKKVGSKFLPPMAQIGPWTNASYARSTLPELIWWDVIAHKSSHQFAIKVAEKIGDHFKGRDEPNCWWAFTSDYRRLSDEEFKSLRQQLDRVNILSPLQSTLADFLELYPECPLGGLLERRPSGAIDIGYLNSFESRMQILEDKRSKEGVWMQAQAIYLGFILGKLKVFKGLALADFPEVGNYPETQRSKEVGASICATINMLSAQMVPQVNDNLWVQYFWKRSYEFRPLKWEHLIHG